MQGFLVSDSDQDDSRRVPIGDSITLGRTPDNGYVVDDNGASRQHVEIVRRDDNYYWEDLDSTNGTFMNDRPMLEGQLQSGDRLRIGNTVILFEVEEEPKKDAGAATSSLFRQTIIDENGVEATPAEVGESESLLNAVYTVMNDITTNYEPCSLVDSVLRTTMKAIDAQRGAVLFSDAHGEAFQPCPVCNYVHIIKDGILSHAEAGDFQISETVAHRVLNGGESVLYKDTGETREINLSESMMYMKLRSIICVPIRGKRGIFGVLYIDSDRPDVHYTHEQMLLSAAVGNSAGLALENARMHVEMLQKQRLEQELAYAGTIQEGFLIKTWPENDPRFQVYGETRPAKTVGGDFYDFVQPTPDSVGILIGDVSGKGIPAALSMAQLLAEFRAQTRNVHSPIDVLEVMNKTLVERSQRGMFCTLCYLLLDLTTGKVTCANAGHHPTLRVNRMDVNEFGEATGVPIGILEEDSWENTEFEIEKGDTILLYTDGIVEARGQATHAGGTPSDSIMEYGLDGLIELTRGLNGQEPKIVVEEVNKDIQRYCLPLLPHDDCTLIALRYVG